MEEAQAGQSRADFVSKYSIALKEARESIYWLRSDHWFNHCKHQERSLTYRVCLLLLPLPSTEPFAAIT